MTIEFKKKTSEDRVIYLRVSFDAFLHAIRSMRNYRSIGVYSQRHPMAYTLACGERRRSRGQPPKVTWQAGSAVRVGAGLPFSQSTAWPFDPARFHRGIETWTVVGCEIPSSIDRRARHADMPISSLSLCEADCVYSSLHNKSRASRRFLESFVARGSLLFFLLFQQS